MPEPWNRQTLIWRNGLRAGPYYLMSEILMRLFCLFRLIYIHQQSDETFSLTKMFDL